jgi:DNA invertase Pin-like site-specific DNA recombinase
MIPRADIGITAPPAIGYCRVSTELQAQEGVSLEAQQAKIRTWCELNGYTLISLHVDAGLSGGRSDNRPGLQQALADVCTQKGALIVYSLSRLARSTKDAIAISERLAKHGADLVSLSERIDTTSASGKMIFRMLAVLAEFERDQISERTKGAMAHLRRQGRRVSRHIPYGFTLNDDGTTLAPHPAEQHGLARIRALRLEGLSLRQIAAALTRSKILTKTGRAWTAKVIHSLLHREAA